MLDRSRKSVIALGALFAVAQVSAAAPKQAGAMQVGMFTGQADVGNPRLSGAAVYAHHRYTLTAGGANVFGAHDEFHFVWREVRGDFSIRARVTFDGPGAEPHRKGGIMARAGLGDASP